MGVKLGLLPQVREGVFWERRAYYIVRTYERNIVNAMNCFSLWPSPDTVWWVVPTATEINKVFSFYQPPFRVVENHRRFRDHLSPSSGHWRNYRTVWPSHFTTDGLSWCRAPVGAHDDILSCTWCARCDEGASVFVVVLKCVSCEPRPSHILPKAPCSILSTSLMWRYWAESTASLNLNSVNQLIFVMVKCGVLFEVRAEFLNNI
jgi:hypothetical protein